MRGHGLRGSPLPCGPLQDTAALCLPQRTAAHCPAHSPLEALTEPCIHSIACDTPLCCDRCVGEAQAAGNSEHHTYGERLRQGLRMLEQLDAHAEGREVPLQRLTHTAPCCPKRTPHSVN